ncbi:uncharacterized protein TNCV_372851 [Trichonephila clavipes]|nr:uncharacterized protein TNCV_372851 [Trichonephila clavipes]
MIVPPCQSFRIRALVNRIALGLVREKSPPQDCAIRVLLESMVFQERMLHGEPTEAKLEEILKNGKEYLPLAMLMTDENSVRWQTMYNYVISGFPQHQGNSSRNVR